MRPFTLVRDRVPEVAALALPLIFILIIAIIFRYLDAANWVRHTLEVQTRIAAIWTRLQDVEIGQRSFVLTGDERFLEPYTRARIGFDGALDSLANLVNDNVEQATAIAEARPIIDERLAFAQKTIEIRRQGDFERAQQLVLQARGLNLTNDLHDRFVSIQQREAKLLDERTRSAQYTIYVLSVALFLGLLGTIGALTSWIVDQRRSSRDLKAANEALRQTIADREAAELQVRQMQKMEAVGQLTGGIAHDFNNMLAVVISGISLASKRLSKGEVGATELLASATDGANRAAALVKKLLAFSRQQPLEPRVIDANNFISGMAELISRTIGETVRMETVLGGGLWRTRADPSQLETAILNLCVNARDAMPNGGRLTLETANCHLDDRYSRLHPDVPAGQYVLIAVTDTGIGIPPGMLSKVFEPFYTTKPPGMGTGLGLSQVFGFVRQSGGHIKIYSEPGQGTTVKIYLPRFFGDLDQVAATGPAIEYKGTETILLVEDDPRVLSLTATALREFGYTVLEAGHPDVGIRHLKNGNKIDLLLTDIVMPDVGGRILADQAVAICPGLKVLFMTGFTKNAVVHNGTLDPGVNFLAKPFTLEELSRKVREALDTKLLR